MSVHIQIQPILHQESLEKKHTHTPQLQSESLWSRTHCYGRPVKVAFEFHTSQQSTFHHTNYDSRRHHTDVFKVTWCPVGFDRGTFESMKS